MENTDTNQPTIEELQAHNAKLQQDNELLSRENKALKQQLVISPQTEKTNANTRPQIPQTTFTIEGKEGEWKFIIPHFKYNGQHITATDALGDDTILKDLVEINSGAIASVK